MKFRNIELHESFLLPSEKQYGQPVQRSILPLIGSGLFDMQIFCDVICRAAAIGVPVTVKVLKALPLIVRQLFPCRFIMNAGDSRFARAFEMEELQGYSVREIAAELQISQPRVYQPIARAKTIGMEYRKING